MRPSLWSLVSPYVSGVAAKPVSWKWRYYRCCCRVQFDLIRKLESSVSRQQFFFCVCTLPDTAASPGSVYVPSQAREGGAELSAVAGEELHSSGCCGGGQKAAPAVLSHTGTRGQFQLPLQLGPHLRPHQVLQGQRLVGLGCLLMGQN